MNGDLIAGRIKVVQKSNEELVREWQTLPWLTRDGRKQEKYDERKYDDHLADACLYGWRDCRAYSATAKVDKPQPDSPEFWQKWAEEEEQRENKEAYMRSQVPWWEEGDGDYESEQQEEWL